MLSQNQQVRNDFFGNRRCEALTEHIKPFLKNIKGNGRQCNHLKHIVAQSNVKVLLKMSDLKHWHARWIVEMYDYLTQQERFDPKRHWESWYNRGCKVSKQSIRETWKLLYRKTSIRLDFFSCSLFLTEENHWNFQIHLSIFFPFLTLWFSIIVNYLLIRFWLKLSLISSTT